jgi:hypothetical protein
MSIPPHRLPQLRRSANVADDKRCKHEPTITVTKGGEVSYRRCPCGFKIERVYGVEEETSGSRKLRG